MSTLAVLFPTLPDPPKVPIPLSKLLNIAAVIGVLEVAVDNEGVEFAQYGAAALTYAAKLFQSVAEIRIVYPCATFEDHEKVFPLGLLLPRLVV